MAYVCSESNLFFHHKVDGICPNDPMSNTGQLSDILLAFKLSSDAIRSLISLNMCVGCNLLITRGLQQAD